MRIVERLFGFSSASLLIKLMVLKIKGQINTFNINPLLNLQYQEQEHH